VRNTEVAESQRIFLAVDDKASRCCSLILVDEQHFHKEEGFLDCTVAANYS